MSLDVRGQISQIDLAEAGVIMIRDIGRDRVFTRYYMYFICSISENIGVPLITCGGARNKHDLMDVIYLGGASPATAGSCFVFKTTTGILF